MKEPVPDAEAEDEIYQPPPGLGQAVVTQIVGQLGGYAIAGPVGAAIAPVITTALDVFMAEVRRNGRRQVDKAVGEAATLSGLEVDSLLQRLVSSPAHMAVLLEAVEAAARTTDPRVVNALGRCLANAATDGAKVQDEILVAKALRELGPAHFRFMRCLLSMSDCVEPPASLPTARRALEMRPEVDRTRVLNFDPHLADVWDVLLAGLLRCGAVVEVERRLGEPRHGIGGQGPAKQSLGSQRWRLTPFGGELYVRVLEAGQGNAPMPD